MNACTREDNQDEVDILIQFLVPLAIMAMWALTSLLNREAQSLPTRGPVPNPGPGRSDPPIGRSEPVNAVAIPAAGPLGRIAPLLSAGPRRRHRLGPDPSASEPLMTGS